jgi:GNAT superfamily N-acetyltransferase
VIRNAASPRPGSVPVAVLNGRVQIERLDPQDLDLDTADGIAEAGNAAHEADAVHVPARSGPATLKYLQLQSDGRPVDGLWVARDETGRVVGNAVLQLPRLENTDSALLRGSVVPEARRQGIGRALLGKALAVVAEAERVKVYSGAFEGSPGGAALAALGFTSLGTVDAVRRVDLDLDSAARWQRLYDDATARAGDYELVHMVGPTPADMLTDLVELHEAINDAPLDDPDLEGDHWSVDRVTSYDRAMAGRSQTVYRVLARHRSSGEWAGMSMLCVDEFSPSVAFQEDTSVVRKHRGHRLGLLMKADMLRWLSQERPEVTATITWNSTSNHHMIAVNEMLGATVVARHANFRLDLDRP